MDEPQPKKGRKKWLIAAAVAGAAVLELVGPAPFGQHLGALIRALLAPRPAGYPDAPPPVEPQLVPGKFAW